jgi:hypothetical protein
MPSTLQRLGSLAARMAYPDRCFVRCDARIGLSSGRIAELPRSAVLVGDRAAPSEGSAFKPREHAVLQYEHQHHEHDDPRHDLDHVELFEPEEEQAMQPVQLARLAGCQGIGASQLIRRLQDPKEPLSSFEGDAKAGAQAMNVLASAVFLFNAREPVNQLGLLLLIGGRALAHSGGTKSTRKRLI